jgi:hydrogenase-4 component B
LVWVLAAIALQVLGAVLALALWKRSALSGKVGAGSLLLAGAVALPAVLRTLLGGGSELVTAPWSVPCGSLSLGLDPLSALFLIPIFVIPPLAAVYGAGYLRGEEGRRPIGASWFFYGLLCASMAGVVLSRNGVLFLVSWEVMSLASYFLVTFQDDDPEVCEAGWTYLGATHLGTAFLLVLFAVIARTCGSLDFDKFGALSQAGPGLASVLFVLALVGFGTKAGLAPFHVWLPEAHPAAPSHVSAVMSGVMLKVGIYGLFRTLVILGPGPAWWGWVLVALGLASALLGALYAMAQGDLKRLLAYSSVENVGIVALAAGLGCLGSAAGQPTLAALGFSAALLHVLNHSFFKSLLFLGAGSVAHGAGTRELDRLGGLLKRMRWTGTSFLMGSAAAVALPPLNGFAGEFLLYLGAFSAATTERAPLAVPSLLAVVGLALVGGLAAAAFLKAFGGAFLGEARTESAAGAQESPSPMLWPMAVLAAACAAAGLGAPWIVGWLSTAAGQLANLDPGAVETSMERAVVVLSRMTFGGAIFLGVAVILALLRRALLKGKSISRGPTWDCGYVAPTSRMQYSPSSFVQPLVDLFSSFTGARSAGDPGEGLFPRTASLRSSAPDRVWRGVYGPFFKGASAVIHRMRFLQQGRVQVYILYIAIALLALLLWRVR